MIWWAIRVVAVTVPLLALFSVGLHLAIPIYRVHRATLTARACLAGYHEPRGAETPACYYLVDEFVASAGAYGATHDATYRAEELYARIAVNIYVDAAVGAPDRLGLSYALPTLERAEQVVAAGSRRVSLEDLGPAMGAPSVGRAADEIGDRKTLLAGAHRWREWQVRKHAIEAALLEADVPRAVELAEHYAADMDQNDLIATVGAMMCVDAKDPGRGADFLEQVARDRAEHRRESFARDFGLEWIASLACATRAGRQLAEHPPGGTAGRAELREVLTVERADLLGKVDPKERAHFLEPLEHLLDAEPPPRAGGLDPLVPAARAAILATLLAASDAPVAPEKLLLLARSRSPGLEDAIALPAALRAVALVSNGQEPPVSSATYELAAQRAGDAAVAAPDGAKSELTAIERGLWQRAAVTRAREGDADAALTALDGGFAANDPSMPLAKACLRHLAGEHEEALAELEKSTSVRTVGSGDPGQNPPSLVRAATLLEHASLLAALRRLDQAYTAAIAADDAAREAGDPDLRAHAAYLRLALTPVGALERDRDVDDLPWVGFADIARRWEDTRGPDGRPALDRTIAAWRLAIGAGDEDRRAARYLAMDRRGDAPPAMPAYLLLGGRLLEPSLAAGSASSESMEIWLDALGAVDAQRTTLRTYAWSRAEAALVRGDALTARLWRDRYAALAKMATEPVTRHIALVLRI